MNEIPKAVFTRKGLVRSGAAQTTQAIQDATRDREARGEAVLSAPAAAAASWDAAYEAKGDIAEEVARLKAQPGRFIMAHGGVGFARSLAERGLVDEYWLAIHPVAIGRGQSLFASLPKPLPLALVSSTAFSSGVKVVCYRP
ncbi:MAG TPA: dihydrofolate reductase family protein, partial [bacterium]